MVNEESGTILESMSKDDIESYLEQITPVNPVVTSNDSNHIIDVQPPQAAMPIVAPAQDSVDDDFEVARQNLKDLAEKGKDVIEDLILLAKQSDQPRAYEVLATTFNTLAGINKDMMELHIKKADTRKKNGTPPQSNQTNIQNNFFGSTADLQKMLKQMPSEE